MDTNGKREKSKRKGALFECLVVLAVEHYNCKLKMTIKANQVKYWFLWRGEKQCTRRKPLGGRHQVKYDTESGPHWWEASACFRIEKVESKSWHDVF